MPYIPQEQRPPLDFYLEALSKLNMTKGEMNYFITRLLCQSLTHGVNYNTISDTRAVLLDVYDEFTRKVMAPYEDRKEQLNGPVHALGGYDNEKSTPVVFVNGFTVK